MSSIISKFKQHTIWLSWKSQCWGVVVPKVMQLASVKEQQSLRKVLQGIPNSKRNKYKSYN